MYLADKELYSAHVPRPTSFHEGSPAAFALMFELGTRPQQ